MAKTRNTGHKVNTPPVGKARRAADTPVAKGLDLGKSSVQAMCAVCVAALTWLFYNVCLNNQFTNWDDPGYIKDNALIKDVSSEGISNIFSLSSPIMGNYHPITILSYAIEYSFVRLRPWLYHFDSLLFHVIVTLLVFWFVNLLTKKPVAAIAASLLFGLHPMHVESVAWIAGRKDVVYGVFYMLACIGYVYYLRSANAKKIALYVSVVILFICSLLSKPVAVVLPLTLLAIDYFEGRKFDKWMVIDKILLLGISVLAGLKSLQDQKAFGSVSTMGATRNIIGRLCLGCYALITYLWKAIAPVSLCNFYPYPDTGDGSLSFMLYLYPVGVAALIFVVWMFARKNKIVIFGSLFFLVNIILLLQFLPVGSAIIADRYAYVSYLGLFFMAGWYVASLYESAGEDKNKRYTIFGIPAAYCLLLGYLSHERCQVWYDTTSLWRDEIEKEPARAPNAYNNLGFNYYSKFNDEVNPAIRKVYYDSAYMLLKKAIELQPTFPNPYVSLGELERGINNFPAAKIYYYTAIHLQESVENANAYLGLGVIYAISHNFDSANYCFATAVKLKPYFPEAHSNYGNFFDMTGLHDEALKQYGIAIEQNPDISAPYLNRARTYQRMRKWNEAMKDFTAAAALTPDMGEIYYYRSYCYNQSGNKRQALQDVEKARSLGFTRIDDNYYNMLKTSAR